MNKLSDESLTRAEIRAQKEKEEQELIERDRKRKQAEKEYKKQLKKEGRLTTSRTEERSKSREAGAILNKAIMIVSGLIVIVMLILFFV